MIGSDPMTGDALIQEFINVISSDESVKELSHVIESQTDCIDIVSGLIVEELIKAIKRRTFPLASMRDVQLRA